MPYLGGGGAGGGPDPRQAEGARAAQGGAKGGQSGRGTGHQGPVGPMGGGYGGGTFGMAKDDWDKALGRAIDRADTGNTTAEDIGNFIADKMFSTREIGSIPKDVNSAYSGQHLTSNQADWGVDPIGLAAGAAGAATGLPIGTTYAAGRFLTNKLGVTDPDWGMINLGHDVFGGGGTTTGGTVGGGTKTGAGGTVGGGNTGNKAGSIGNAKGGGDQGGGFNIGGKKTVIPPPNKTITPPNNPFKPPPNKPVVPPPTKPPVTPPPPPPTWAAELAASMPKLRADFDWNLKQRGLGANTLDFGGKPINWDNVFNEELAHRQAGMPTGAFTPGDKTSYDKAINQYLLANFGSGALDDYQTRLRSDARTNIGSLGLDKEFNTRFGQDDVQGYLNDVYNTQYGAAKKMIDNVNARGEFNSFGYNSALQDLNRQGIAGKSTLNDLAGSYLTTAKGTLNDALSGIYDKIGSYTLGSGYNPTSDVSDLRSKENTLAGGLQGQILGGAPSIFDTSSTMQRASSQQGATSTGSLMDTLSQRNANTGQRSRGLANTGAF